MFSSSSFLDNFIENQRKAMKYHLAFAISLLGLGILIVLMVIVWPDTFSSDTLKTILSIGGALISSISAFPIKEIIVRKERVGAFQSMKLILRDADQTELDKIEELVWKTIEKTALG